MPFSLSCGRSNRHGPWKEKYQLGTSKTKFSALRRFICPRATESREKETGDSGGGRRGRERGTWGRLQRDKGLPLDREETDMVHRKMAVYKEGIPC